MKVWRVQNQNGVGPYSATGYWNWTDRQHNDPEHPAPWEDQLLSSQWGDLPLDERDRMRFGFASMEQLRAWFSEDEITRMAAIGFHVVVLDIPDEKVLYGDKQVVFRVEHAMPRTGIQIIEYYEPPGFSYTVGSGGSGGSGQ